MMPNDLPPWAAVFQHTQRRRRAGVVEAVGHDLRGVLRLAEGRTGQPAAALVASRARPSTPESGCRASDDGAKRQRRSQVQMAVDTLGPLLAAHITAANAQDRAQVEQLARKVQAVTGDAVEVAFVDRGYTGDHPGREAAVHGLPVEVVKRPEAKAGFVRSPRRWVVKRRVAWTACFRRLARDHERLPATLASFHFPLFAILMLKRCVELMTYSA